MCLKKEYTLVIASGVVPDSFRILRILLERIEIKLPAKLKCLSFIVPYHLLEKWRQHAVHKQSVLNLLKGFLGLMKLGWYMMT